MNNHKSIYCAMLTLFIATACQVIDDGEISYYQFTPDDLSYLYYDQDTLLFTKNIQYIDTVVFLRNGTDTVVVEAKTIIESFKTLASWPSTRNLHGASTLFFSEEDGFAVAQISVSRSTKTLFGKLFSRQRQIVSSDGIFTRYTNFW